MRVVDGVRLSVVVNREVCGSAANGGGDGSRDVPWPRAEERAQ